MLEIVTLSTYNIETLKPRGSVKLDVHTAGQALLVIAAINHEFGEDLMVTIGLESTGDLVASVTDLQGNHHRHTLAKVGLKPQGSLHHWEQGGK